MSEQRLPVDLEAIPAPVSESRSRQVEAAINAWRNQLVDVGGNNTLLYYRDLKVGTLDLTEANPDALARLLDGHQLTLSSLAPAGKHPDWLKRARRVRATGREYEEERGLTTLYLVTGMATWTNQQSTSTPCAPVMLRPINFLQVGGKDEDFHLVITGETELNPTLTHYLRTGYGIDIDEDTFLDEDEETDPTAFERLTHLCEAVPGFAISERHVVGNFSYAKLPMVNDLEANLDLMATSEIIAALAGDPAARNGLRTGGGEPSELEPNYVPPADEFLVLDADSSQNYAINRVLSGQSIVISGPPGTGKSQTIANLISTLVARGQKVLFVAEKRAAIEAVLKRLDERGLSELMLDMHQKTINKKEFYTQIAQTLTRHSQIARPDLTALHEQVVTRRTSLNAHDAAMHEKREPWGLSIFELQAALLGMSPASQTECRFGPDVLQSLDAAGHRNAKDVLKNYQLRHGFDRDRNPWRRSMVQSPEQASAAFTTSHRLATATLPAVNARLDQVLNDTGLHRPKSIEAWQEIFGLLDRVEAASPIYRQDLYSQDLAALVRFTLPRSQRKSAPSSFGERRRARKQAKALMLTKLSASKLHETLQQAAAICKEWRAKSGGSKPILPADLTGASGSYLQLCDELRALGAYLPQLALLGTPDDVMRSVADLARDAERATAAAELNRLASLLKQYGLGELVEEISARALQGDLVLEAFDRAWMHSILNSLTFTDQRLGSFHAEVQNHTVAEFQQADKEHLKTTSVRVLRAVAEASTKARDEFPDQAMLVQSQARLKRAHKPVKTVVAQAKDVLTALRPCWAMSPLVVSQMLPMQRMFDVVVFDEASQITPADAIAAIARGERLVVAGDSKQLPPTAFFVGGGADDEIDESEGVNDDGEITIDLTSGYESILDVSESIMRISSLTWHYRSRDERLIAYSNEEIYRRSLTTFPGVAGPESLQFTAALPNAGEPAKDYGSETREVVELVLKHAATDPHLSLGVIALGSPHRTRIESALRDARRLRPELDAFFDEGKQEAFFIKNLERVQGDERDVIILSTGLGRTATGSISHNFGPVNKNGGERRLNVAITRAKHRMHVVTSFNPDDLDPNKCHSDGMKMLRGYLQYVESGGTNLGQHVDRTIPLNPFEINVRDRLNAAGIPLVAQYGVAGYRIDFVASHPNKPGRMVLAIEADGARYHSSITARDRDRLRQEHLERLGFTFHRIWSTNWFRDPDTEIAQARFAYDQAVTAADREAAEEQRRRDAAANAILSDQVPAAPTPAPRAVPAPAAAAAPARSSINPPISRLAREAEWSDADLRRIITWVRSDGLLRSVDETVEECKAAMRFERLRAKLRERIVAQIEKTKD